MLVMCLWRLCSVRVGLVEAPQGALTAPPPPRRASVEASIHPSCSLSDCRMPVGLDVDTLEVDTAAVDRTQIQVGIPVPVMVCRRVPKPLALADYLDGKWSLPGGQSIVDVGACEGVCLTTQLTGPKSCEPVRTETVLLQRADSRRPARLEIVRDCACVCDRIERLPGPALCSALPCLPCPALRLNPPRQAPAPHWAHLCGSVAAHAQRERHTQAEGDAGQRAGDYGTVAATDTHQHQHGMAQAHMECQARHQHQHMQHGQQPMPPIPPPNSHTRTTRHGTGNRRGGPFPGGLKWTSGHPPPPPPGPLPYAPRSAALSFPNGTFENSPARTCRQTAQDLLGDPHVPHNAHPPKGTGG